MKKINNKGFTLIELLATITILAVVLSITLFFGVNLIKNAREKSYEVTKNNVEKAAVAYLKENNDITFVERNDVSEKTEYQCIKVKNLIDYGYFDTEILKSEYKQDEKVTPDQFIYVERNKTTKTITNSSFPATESFCEAIQNKNIIINYDKGWAKSKKVKITYKLSSITSQNELKEFKYLYDINGTNQIDETFENRTISKSFNITENNSEIYAKIYNINNSDDSISKTTKISKIDNKKPYIESLSADNGKSETKNILVTIVDKETKQNETKDASGFDANDKMLTVQYGWSLSNKEAPTEYKDAKISYEDCNEKNPTLECKKATFNAVYDEKVNGAYYLWIKPNMKDMAGNTVSEYISDGTYLVEIAPTISNISYKDCGNTDFSGTHEENYPLEYKTGIEVILDVPTKAGYNFAGYFAEGTCSGTSVTNIKSDEYGDKTFYAKWTLKALTLNDQTLASGAYNAAYNKSYTGASGGTDSYDYIVKSVKLNGTTVSANSGKYNGLSINGTTISGTPSKTGEYKFEIEAKDKNSGASATATITVPINKASSTCTISTVPSLTYPSSVTGITSYSCTGDGVINVTSGNSNIIKVSTKNNTSATLTATGSGQTTITVTQTEGTNYLGASTSKTITIGLESYTIEYDLNGGTLETNAPKNAKYNEDIQISKPTKSGYEFVGWTASGLGNSAKTGNASNPTTSWTGTSTTNTYFKNLRDSSGTVTLTANWKYTATFYYYNGTSVTSIKESCTGGTSCTLSIPNAVRTSIGEYNSGYNGLAVKRGTMQVDIAKDKTSIVINSNVTYYSTYNSKVTIYYPSSETAISYKEFNKNEYITDTNTNWVVINSNNTSTTNIETIDGIYGTLLGFNDNPNDTQYSTPNAVNGNKKSNVLYAVTKRSITATFYYQSNATEGTCSVTSTKASGDRLYYCKNTTTLGKEDNLITVPTVVKNSVGKYNSKYNGTALNVGTMTQKTPTTVATTYYAVYQTQVSNTYYNITSKKYESRTLYRNEWLSSESVCADPVLGISNGSTSNYQAQSGPENSTWEGLATNNTTIPTYKSISDAAKSTVTVLNTVYKFNINYLKGVNVSAIGKTNDSCNITASGTSTNCTVTLPSITPNSGYTSVGWNSTSGATTGTQANLTYTVSKNNQTLYANATANVITFNNQTLSSGSYNDTYSNSFTGASNGTGLYEYTITDVTLDGVSVTASSGKYNGLGLSSTTITGTPSTAGTYKFVIKAKDKGSNAEKSATMTITIAKTQNPISVTANTLTYNMQSQQLVSVTGAQWNVCYSTSAAVSSCSTAGTIPTGTNAGNYTVYWYVAGNTNYSSKSGSVTVTINKYDLSNATIKDVEQKEYEHNTVYRPEPTVTVPLSGTTTLAKGTDFNYSYSNYDKIGTATITVTAIDGGNYKGTNSTTFTIADTTKPVCKFESWVPSEIVTDETAAITLTCTDYGSLISPPTISTTDFLTSNVDILMVLRSDNSQTDPTEEVKYTITVQGTQAGTGSIVLNSKMVYDVAGNVKESVTFAPALTIKERELSCTISYDKSSNKILQVQSGRTDVSIRAGASTASTRLAYVDGGAQFPFISTEGTTGCSGGWKKILYNKTTEAYICGTYTEELDYSSETYTDNYYKIIDLKINASGASNVTYSFDGTTFTESNTLPTITSGTHTAYIKDSNDEIKSCSIEIERKTEYRKEQYKSTTTKTNSSFQYRGDVPFPCNVYPSCSSVNTSALTYTCETCKSMSITVCPTDATGWTSCHEREVKTKTCEPSGTIVGYSEWTTDKLYKDCYNKINTRTRYGAE